MTMQRGFHSQQRPAAAVPVRNPWVDRHPESSSSSARSLRRAQPHTRPHTIIPMHSGPPPASEWLRPGPSQRLHGPQLNQQPVIQSLGSSPAESAAGVATNFPSPGCAKCDSFCYYCLQVVYIAGILTGLSLVIAGGVLKSSPRRGDLLVLVYIGVLVAAVCTLLLSVQYCVRNTVKQRKRALRSNRVVSAQPMVEMTELQQVQHPRHPHDFTDVRIEVPPNRREVPSYPVETRPPPAPAVGRQYPIDVREYPADFTDVRRSGRSRSSHSSYGRRYYLHDEPDGPYRPEEWERERQPYQPLIHRPR